jgi:D-beta-D-heptose 7-phosphate kinase/D-beta-D-heptose 1-phosphate adenosyltransferase
MTTNFRDSSDVPGICSWAELRLALDRLKAEGKKIVFTNGVFDLLHTGHIQYLRESKALGNVLVVALNSDSSVTRLKGPGRPILPLVERAKIMGALESVDFATAFDEDTPLEVISALQPDVLVKGGDYQPSDVVGKDVVEAGGGVCKTLGFVEGISSTNVIQRILDSAARAARASSDK